MRTGRVDRTRPVAIDEDLHTQFAELGVQVPISDEDGDVLSIMPNGWESFCLFMECQTQWRVVAGMAGVVWLGLDYSACQHVLDVIDFEKDQRKRAFADMRSMEAAALPILNEAE